MNLYQKCYSFYFISSSYGEHVEILFSSLRPDLKVISESYIWKVGLKKRFKDHWSGVLRSENKQRLHRMKKLNQSSQIPTDCVKIAYLKVHLLVATQWKCSPWMCIRSPATEQRHRHLWVYCSIVVLVVLQSTIKPIVHFLFLSCGCWQTLGTASLHTWLSLQTQSYQTRLCCSATDFSRS